MKLGYSIAATCSIFALATGTASAQSVTTDNATRSYETVLKLIKVMVADGLLSQAQADKLIAEANAPAPQGTGEAPAPAPTVPIAASTPETPSSPTPTGNAYLQDGHAGKSFTNPNLNTIGATVDATKARIADAKARPSPSGLKVLWGPGAPLFSSSDGYFTMKLRGRIALDAQTTTGSSSDRRNITTTGSRALRLGIDGTVGTHIIYQFENDWAENRSVVQGAFIGWRDKVLGHDYDIRFGNATLDRGMEFSYNFDSQAFADRSVVSTATLAQTNFFGMGVHARLFGKGWHIGTSLIGDTLDGAKAYSDNRTWSIRSHYNPIMTRNDIVHVGGWYMNEHISNAPQTIARQVAIGGRFNDNLNVTTGPLPSADGSEAFGAEFLYAHRNFYTWSEYAQRRIDFVAGTAIPSMTQKAWAVSGGWFITGETAPYSARNGNFEYPKVRSSVFDGGPGAISVVARYENVDFSSAPQGGVGDAYTLGANWYLTDNVRLLANLIHWHTDNQAGTVIGPDSGNSLIVRGAVIF